MVKVHGIDEVEGFCGWGFLRSLVGVYDFPPYQGFVAALFETGGRVSEVLALTVDNFNLDVHPEVVVVERMPVLKRYDVVGSVPDPCKKSGFRCLTRRVRDHRHFPIRRDEPLVPYLLKWLDQCDGPLFRFNRLQAFQMLREAGKRLNMSIPMTKHRYENRPLHSSEIFPHLLRAERASHLAQEYEFDILALRQFFGWRPRKMDMAEKYASLSWQGLARRMGVHL